MLHQEGPGHADPYLQDLGPAPETKQRFPCSLVLLFGGAPSTSQTAPAGRHLAEERLPQHSADHGNLPGMERLVPTAMRNDAGLIVVMRVRSSSIGGEGLFGEKRIAHAANCRQRLLVNRLHGVENYLHRRIIMLAGGFHRPSDGKVVGESGVEQPPRIQASHVNQ